jgi:hypothetical protein
LDSLPFSIDTDVVMSHVTLVRCATADRMVVTRALSVTRAITGVAPASGAHQGTARDGREPRRYAGTCGHMSGMHGGIRGLRSGVTLSH